MGGSQTGTFRNLSIVQYCPTLSNIVPESSTINCKETWPGVTHENLTYGLMTKFKPKKHMNIGKLEECLVTIEPEVVFYFLMQYKRRRVNL